MARQTRSEKFKQEAREKRKPPKITGEKGRTAHELIGIIRPLRSRKNSRLYTMKARDFRAWFKKKHKFEYPYRVPRQSIARDIKHK